MTSSKVLRCCDKPATANPEFDPLDPDPATAAAPHRVFNIGNSQPTELLRFIEVMEQALGRDRGEGLSAHAARGCRGDGCRHPGLGGLGRV